MKQNNVYGENCLSGARVHGWFKRIKEDREDSPVRKVSRSSNIEIMHEFLKSRRKSSLRYILRLTLHYVSTEKLGLRKVYARFVLYK